MTTLNYNEGSSVKKIKQTFPYNHTYFAFAFSDVCIYLCSVM